MKHLILIFLSLVVFGCNSKKEQISKDVPTNTTFNKLIELVDNYSEEILKRGNANSFALAIYKDGHMYQNYYGEIDKKATNKPTDSSLYEVASVTKTFTGSLVAKAVLEGEINLDDDIRNYLDDDYPNLEFEGHPITIKNLLTHTLGLKNKSPKRLSDIRDKVINGTYNSDIDSYNIQDLLEELKAVEVNKKPGTVFAYNSVGPELLAYVLEKVNKKPFKEQIETFFKEIGMQNTYLQDYNQHKKNLVRGYRNDTIAHIDFCPVYGAAGGAIATLPDLANYMKYLIENKNKPWIKEASRSLFVDPEDDEQIGYLWQNIGVGEEEGYYYSKTGTSNGIQSGVLICPDSNYGIVLMVNNTSEEAYNDWVTLFFRDIEPDLIKYPKLNLSSILKKEFIDNPGTAFTEFRELKSDTTNYFFNMRSLNNFGYELLNNNKAEKAITFFKFLTEEFPEDANTYDSLGETYFVVEDYDNALLNYKKSLELNPNSDNAKAYIKNIEDLNN